MQWIKFIFSICIFIWSVPVKPCSHIIVSTQDENVVIGRTMELGANLNGEPKNWTISVHPREKKVDPSIACAGKTDGWTNKYGFISIDPSACDGMNEYGLTASCQTLRMSKYQYSQPDKASICWADFVAWILGNFKTVSEVETALHETKIIQDFGPVVPSGDNLHWAIEDADGKAIVVEYINSQLNIHNNTVGVMTNDPSFDWHLYNLDQYANLIPTWPIKLPHIVTEIGPVPKIIGHGFNLHGIPGDYTPASRFVRLFYLRTFADLNHPAKNINDGIVEVTGILNNMFITMGTVAKTNDEGYEMTQYSVIKIPTKKEYLFKSYNNMQWKRIRLSNLNFTREMSLPVFDGTLGIKDVSF